MRADLSFEVWRNKILCELEEIQRELRAKMVPPTHNPIGRVSAAPAVHAPHHTRSAPRAAVNNRAGRKPSSTVTFPHVTVPVRRVPPQRTVSTLESVHAPLPPIVRKNHTFWQRRSTPAPAAKSTDEARQIKAAQTVEAYSKLSPEARLERAARMQAEYEAECQRLGM